MSTELTFIAIDARMQALWAKTDPYHPLWCHLIDTAAICERLIDCLGLPTDLSVKWTIFLAAMHDIGKADPKFQMMNSQQHVCSRLRGLYNHVQ